MRLAQVRVSAAQADGARGRWRVRRADIGVLVPLLILLAAVISAIAGQYVVPHDPELTSLGHRFRPPMWVTGGSAEYPLGTDALGRDVLSRVVVGARASVVVAVVTILLAGGIGCLLGMISGYYGGKVDAAIMRLVDATFAFPIIFLALLMAAVLGPGLGNLIVIIPLVLWSRFARLVRVEVLSLKTRDYVAAAVISGAAPRRIMGKHLLPNLLNTVVVFSTLQVGAVIIFESSLSFLGVGVPPPTPAWGSMLAAGRNDLTNAWWVSVMPGVAILLTVLSLNLLGDQLRDRLDPRIRRRQ